jgi:hypothetical protein
VGEAGSNLLVHMISIGIPAVAALSGRGEGSAFCDKNRYHVVLECAVT